MYLHSNFSLHIYIFFFCLEDIKKSYFIFFSDAKELLNSNEEIAFVLEEFEGPIYDYLHSLKKTIFGPTLVQQLAARGLPPQPCERWFSVTRFDYKVHMF